VDPLAAEFYCVWAGNYREVVANLCSPKRFIHVWLQKERISEAERGRRRTAKTHRRVCRNVRIGRASWTFLVRICEMQLIKQCRRKRGVEVRVEDIDL